MQTKLSKVFLVLIFTVFAINSWAVVSDYIFTSTTGTYTEISGGTVLPNPVAPEVNPTYNAIPLGFSFEYDDIAYTTVSIAENGYLAMGDEVLTNNLPISAATGTNNVVAALSRDILAQNDGELMYLLSGTAPNRVFTVQWKNFRRVPTSAAADVINFQIQLHEGSNDVVFCYGTVNVINVVTAATVQVGLRGASNLDFNNRTTTTDWAATEAGTANNNSCRLNNTVYPTTGLTFSFAPVQQGAPPMPAQNPQPANAASTVNPGTALSWLTGGGAPTGYKVYLGTNNPPTNIANGTVVTETVYAPAAPLSYNTTYYWQIVPFNADGDAVGCPVWSFTTWADPTINTYPYTQGFDEVSTPALPIGWSVVNANADTYSWESYADTGANTAPNSVRIRYNSTMAMDDWLISPPLQLTAEYAYKIRFYYRANSASYPEKLALYKGTAANPTALTQLLWSNDNITNSEYELAEVIVPATTAETIYLGFHGHSEADQFYLYMDSFSIAELTETLYPPSNLQAAVIGNDVHLSWEAPTPPPSGEWITWCNTEDLGNGIGTNAAAEFDVAHRFDATDLAPYQGSTLTHVQIVPNEVNCVYTLKIWTGTSAAQPTTMVHSQAILAPVIGEWNTIELSSPVAIPATGELWIGYGVDTQTGYPAGCDDGPQIEGKGNMMNFDGWDTLTGVAPTLTYNWSIQGYVDNEFRALSFASKGTPALPNTRPEGTLAKSGVNRTVNREHNGYKVYRDGNLISTISDPQTLTYIDADLALGDYSYTLTANYDDGESTAIGPVNVTIADLIAPLDLAATVEGNDVNLTWTSPVPPLTGEWITWCNTEALGNSVGTDSAAEFDVAHMYDAADLAAHQGGSLAQIKFVPVYQACTYTVKVWTGGTAAAPANLVYSAVHESPILNDWNLHVLSTPIPIPADRLWIGYGVDTQGGFPAGCDDGPQVEGKGNMMNFGGWSTLTALAPTLTYNWSIQGFVADGATLKSINFKPIAEESLSTPKGTLAANRFEPARTDRALLGYKVYRDGAQIANITDPEQTTYTDLDLPNGEYVYGVTAMYGEGESDPATVNVTVNMQLAPVLFGDSFEEYDDFALLFAPWTLLDQDLSETYGFDGITFPNSNSPMAYIVFNPNSTVPAITSLSAYDGDKMAASFAAVNPINNDWLITPRMTLGTQSALKFYARSHMADYGLERFRVGVSTIPTIIPQGFQYITGPDYVEAPTNWTEYIYDLSAYDGQGVYIAIRCVSDDAFVFYLDDISVHSVGGSVSNDDPSVPANLTELKGNYPNPFNPQTTIRFSVRESAPVSIEIYNVKGQLVKTLLSEVKSAGEHSVIWKGTDNNNRPVSSGVYFYKMNAGKYSSTKKMIMMK